MKRAIIAIVVASLAAVLAACGSASRSSSATGAPSPTPTGWLGEQSATAPQNEAAVIKVPRSFRDARLLVALVAADGPDTIPEGRTVSETSAVFGGSSPLQWTRAARASARHDWAEGNAPRERYGASVTEVWTAVPPAGWQPGTITATTTHPDTRDDGLAVTIVAFSHATLARVKTIDGMHTRAERLRVAVAPGDMLYAASFAGRRNANFVPLAGLRRVAQRRAGDDTAGVLAYKTTAAATGTETVGYASPNPGDFWEMAVVVIAPAPKV
jgi:hypothetical protein